MNELCLFAGAGGGILGSILLGWRVVCYVENDPYCIEVLKARIKDDIYDDAPIWDDVRTFDGRPWRGCVDIVTAGFPCQPFSIAGKRAGADDERNMWPDTLRIISEVRPRFAFLENVPGLLSSGYFGTILGDLSEIGYDARWTVLGAGDVGAPHRRWRLWILAHTKCDRLETDTNDRQICEQAPEGRPTRHTSTAMCEGVQVWDTDAPPRTSFCGVRDGVAHRVNRLKAIGNGQVPAVVRAAWMLLSEGL